MFRIFPQLPGTGQGVVAPNPTPRGSTSIGEPLPNGATPNPPGRVPVSPARCDPAGRSPELLSHPTTVGFGDSEILGFGNLEIWGIFRFWDLGISHRCFHQVARPLPWIEFSWNEGGVGDQTPNAKKSRIDLGMLPLDLLPFPGTFFSSGVGIRVTVGITVGVTVVVVILLVFLVFFWKCKGQPGPEPGLALDKHRAVPGLTMDQFGPVLGLAMDQCRLVQTSAGTGLGPVWTSGDHLMGNSRHSNISHGQTCMDQP
ncbi:hypothetical protein HGM15179_021298 [Zosterops borbonicus]|uniref:Uncharacterized protein n=1 Tax=Zosterops borbonicus TaxID=364589 RepID=A0A8K1D615_9PASS|nr:hypothetical protein HGM15179_021298 [Zosterops borbonicus]